MRALDVENIFSGYESVEILHGISMRVEEKEIVTIIGPNGCGKSTLLKTIMGHLTPNQGRISYQGEDVTYLRPDEKVKSGINYVPQLDNVFPSLTVLENLEMGGYLLSKRDLCDRIDPIFTLFPILKNRAAQTAGTLSGGERQMLALGSALMMNPKLLLLDEPTAALAPAMALSIFEKIRDINHMDTTIVIVEQNAFESLAISNRGYVLAMGQNEFEGNAGQILGSEKVRKAYLGG